MDVEETFDASTFVSVVDRSLYVYTRDFRIQGDQTSVRFSIERYEAKAGARLVLTNNERLWVADVVDLGAVRMFRNAQHLIDHVTRVADAFAKSDRCHGGFVDVMNSYEVLRPEPWYVHLHQLTRTGWTETRIHVGVDYGDLRLGVGQAVHAAAARAIKKYYRGC